MDFDNEATAHGAANGPDRVSGHTGNGTDVRGVTEFDALLRRRLRQARLAESLTQEGLAKKIGISFQQIQKYENGSNRISAGRLLEVARVLGRPVSYFYDEAGMTGDTDMPDRVMRAARELEAIPDGAIKNGLFQLIKTVGREMGGAT